MHKKFKSEESLVKYLTRQQEKQALNAFQLFDQDGSGAISIREFEEVMKILGQTIQEDQLQRIINEIDRDGNGLIDFKQFLELVAPKIISNRSERTYLQAFKILDDSDDGLINLEELVRANTISQAGLSQHQLQEILTYVELNFKGNLNFTNALKMLYRIPHH